MQMFHTSMSAEFQGTLVKWGTSIGLAIPKPIRDGMKLKAGDKIRMLLRDNMICIQKVKQ
jgi:antitoxin component of MazEF toxin-antitoxin module